MAGLLFVALHTLGKLHLVFRELDNIPVVTLNVCMMVPQPSVVSVKLLLDDGVPLPQTSNQHLIVVDEELDVLPVLANLLFKTIALKWSLC